MSNDLEPKAGLEISHVLFIDVVGYSTRLINEQSAVVAVLNQLVRETSHFRSAEAAGKLISVFQPEHRYLIVVELPAARISSLRSGMNERRNNQM